MFAQLTLCRAFQPLTNVDPDPKFVNKIYTAYQYHSLGSAQGVCMLFQKCGLKLLVFCLAGNK